MNPRVLVLLVLCFCACSVVVSAQNTDQAPLPAEWLELSPTGPWVVVLEFDTREKATALSAWLDVWEILPEKGTLQALVSTDAYHELIAQGFEPFLDEEQTRVLASLGIPLELQGNGIPGFPCYRTVSETYTAAQAIADANPGLASWIDVGDSWEKTQDPQAGWDLRVLKLTQSAVTGTKPVFFASFAIHGREYTTAELGTRFAEHLVDGYGTDPDITWLLDFHEVHLMLVSNPDGRARAETGVLWRKNTNNDYCSNTGSRGADLNRNFEFLWDCCGGGSDNPCSEIYRGPLAASEPEIQAVQSYVRTIFPDQRGAANSDPAPDDATGVAIDVHSFGRLVLVPWVWSSAPAPNGPAFSTLGRKVAFFNGYRPQQGIFSAVDGSSIDFYYGDLGVAGLGFELGTTFFESCNSFESDVVDVNIDALLYAAKAARAPYQLPAGPEAFQATVSRPSVFAGELLELRASVDDTRFNQSNGAEPTQLIASAEAFLDTPPWEATAAALTMDASDGTFDEEAEEVELVIETAGLSDGRHILYVRGSDTDGNTGVVTAVFFEVIEGGIFVDGFESGGTTAWSTTVP